MFLVSTCRYRILSEEAVPSSYFYFLVLLGALPVLVSLPSKVWVLAEDGSAATISYRMRVIGRRVVARYFHIAA